MKKVAVSVAALLSIVVLAGCGNSKSSSSDSSSKTSSSELSSTTSKSAQYDSIATGAIHELNQSNPGKYSYKIQKDTVDDDSTPHTVVTILVKNHSIYETFNKADMADKNDSATAKQKGLLVKTRGIISNYAKKFSNKHDVLSYGYQTDSDNTTIFARSTKVKDTIK